jgi:hypothetical protein
MCSKIEPVGTNWGANAETLRTAALTADQHNAVNFWHCKINAITMNVKAGEHRCNKTVTSSNQYL